MRFIVFITIFLFSLCGCQDVSYPEPPENLLSREKFTQVLADAYVGNASRSKSVNNRILRNNGIKLDSLLYNKHQVDSASFAASNTYYASNLEGYTAIILEVQRLLSARKSEMDTLLQRKQQKNKSKGDTTKYTSFKTPEKGQLVEPVEEDEEE